MDIDKYFEEAKEEIKSLSDEEFLELLEEAGLDVKEVDDESASEEDIKGLGAKIFDDIDIEDI